MKNKTEAYSVQVDKKQLEQAKAMVNLPEAIRALVNKLTKTKHCPCCGNRLKE
jgi:hypothetical protein